MSQVPVKWVTQNSLMDPDATKNFMAWKDRPAHYIPVVELSALREVVEGLKYIEAVLCERKLCGHFTAEEIRQETQRLLASLDAEGVQ